MIWEALNQLLLASVLLIVLSLFILKSILNIRNARKELNKKELSKWSRYYAIFTVVSNSIIILVMAAIILYF